MAEIILTLIVFALLGYVVFLNLQHKKETQLLLDRIMAKNLAEFQEHTVPLKRESAETKPSEYVSVQELPDDKWDEMIKDQAGTISPTKKAIKKLKSMVRK